MTDDLVLIGLSGNTLEIFEACEAAFRIVAVLSDDPTHGSEFEGVPIRPLRDASGFSEAKFVYLIGSPRSFRTRMSLLAGLGLAPDRFVKIIHPQASLSRFARIGAGCILFQGTTVTANAEIGRHTIVLPQSVIHHDVTIGDGSIIGSSVTVAGGVEIGPGCYVGSGSSIRDGVRVGAGALIGLGSVVVHDVAPGAVVAGNPARPLVKQGSARNGARR